MPHLGRKKIDQFLESSFEFLCTSHTLSFSVLARPKQRNIYEPLGNSRGAFRPHAYMILHTAGFFCITYTEICVNATAGSSMALCFNFVVLLALM